MARLLLGYVFILLHSRKGLFRYGDEAGDETGDETGDEMGDKTGDEIGDEIGDETGDETGDKTGDETGDEIGDEISALEKHRNLFLWPELCIAFGQPFWHTILVF